MPFKLIPLTFKKMWKCHKRSFQYIHILGCPTPKGRQVGSKVLGMPVYRLSKRDKRVLIL